MLRAADRGWSWLLLFLVGDVGQDGALLSADPHHVDSFGGRAPKSLLGEPKNLLSALATALWHAQERILLSLQTRRAAPGERPVEEGSHAVVLAACGQVNQARLGPRRCEFFSRLFTTETSRQGGATGVRERLAGEGTCWNSFASTSNARLST